MQLRDDVSAEIKSQQKSARRILMYREAWRTLFIALAFDAALRMMPDVVAVVHKWAQRF